MGSLLSGRCVEMVVMGLRPAGREECRGENNADERDLGATQSRTTKRGCPWRSAQRRQRIPLLLAHVRTPSQIPELSTTVADR